MVKDITGQKHNRLTAIKYIRVNSCGQSVWLFLCECGTYSERAGTEVTTGRAKSCGCYNKERITETLIKDITNQKFGKLTALSIDNNNSAVKKWKCRCDCGKYTVVDGTSLRAGRTKSCGCYRVETAKQRCGPKHYLWDFTLSDSERLSEISQRKRETPEIINWRKLVFTLHDYTCRKCGVKGKNINAHHIYNWKDYPDLRLDPKNGVALCIYCHKKFHKEYGKRHNNPDQLKEFLGSLNEGKTD